MNTNEQNIREVNILGEKYTIIVANQVTDPKFTTISGYCDDTKKVCAVDDFSMSSDPFIKGDIQALVKMNLRHEIVHAFLCESGLAECSEWATNEEIVDWIARQGLKLYKAWQEAGAIE